MLNYIHIIVKNAYLFKQLPYSDKANKCGVNSFISVLLDGRKHHLLNHKSGSQILTFHLPRIKHVQPIGQLQVEKHVQTIARIENDCSLCSLHKGV